MRRTSETSQAESNNKITSSSRRTALTRIFLVSGTIAGSLGAPKAWQTPIIDSIFLPAHAATTEQIGQIAFNSGVMRQAQSETRTPSGSGAVEALASVRFAGCMGLPSVPVTCSARADLGGGVFVDIGSATGTSNNSGTFSINIPTPILAVAPISAIVAIEFTCSSFGVVDVVVLPGAALSGALAGSGSPVPSCSV